MRFPLSVCKRFNHLRADISAACLLSHRYTLQFLLHAKTSHPGHIAGNINKKPLKSVAAGSWVVAGLSASAGQTGNRIRKD